MYQFNNNESMEVPPLDAQYPMHRHISRAELKRALTAKLQSMGIIVTSIQEIDNDKGQPLRHACIVSERVFALPRQEFQYEYMVISYWVCNACGVVRVYIEPY